MTVPAVTFIEIAIQQLRDKAADTSEKGAAFWLNKELREFLELGGERIDALRSGLEKLPSLPDGAMGQPMATWAKSATSNGTRGQAAQPDLELGYLLGLETARVMLAMNPGAAAAKVEL